MNLGKACAIFKQLEKDEYTDAEKIEAIRMVLDMETHNSITKLDFMYALAWLWNFTYHKVFNGETPKWIPVTDRPMTEEEAKERCETLGVKEGSLEDWEARVFTCHLPDDGQEILISRGKYVEEDICSWDEYGCGLENNGDWDGVDAWMPKPEPYKKEGAE